MADCDCCDVPNEMGKEFASFCTLHKHTATNTPPWSVADDWSRVHCQGTAGKFSLGISAFKVRSDGTDLYVFGGGCGERRSVYNSSGADTFVWPVGVRKITVTMVGGGGDGGSGAGASGGGGGGAWVTKEFTRSYNDNSTRTDNLYVGAGGEDSWYVDSSTTLAKAGSDASTGTGGAGGAAGSCIGDTAHSGGDGADASGLDGGGGGGAAGGQPFGSSADGGDASGTTAGTGVYTSGDGGDGGTNTNPGSNGGAPGGGGGGSGAASSSPGTGNIGKIIVSYHVRRPLQKWNSSGVFQWEVETSIDNDTLEGCFPQGLAVHNGLVVAITNSSSDGTGNSYVIAVTASTGAISWVYQNEYALKDVAIAGSGVYTISSDYITNWNTSGTLLHEKFVVEPQVEPFHGEFSASGQSIAVDSNCHVYASFTGRSYELSSLGGGVFNPGLDPTVVGNVAKYAPLDTATDDDPPVMLAVEELGYVDCGAGDVLTLFQNNSWGDIMPRISLSPNESDLYVAFRTPENDFCPLIQMDTSDMSINWGTFPPTTTVDGEPTRQYLIRDLVARNDGAIGVSFAANRYPGFFGPPSDVDYENLVFSTDGSGSIQYELGYVNPLENGGGFLNINSTGRVLTACSLLATSGVFFTGTESTQCTSASYDPESDYDESTCCESELAEIDTGTCGVYVPACVAGNEIPTTVTGTIPPFACWTLEGNIDTDCLTCLEDVAGDSITFKAVQRRDSSRVWKASLRMQCCDSAYDCGDDHWLDLYAINHALNAWRVTAVFKCGCDGYDETAYIIEAQHVMGHCGDDTHSHPWYTICCPDCESNDPIQQGVCLWQWDGSGWTNIGRTLGSGFTCDGAEPASDGTTNCETQCTCPCGVGCTETQEGDAVWSRNCPCETIPKQFTGTLYGVDCFEGETFEITYNWDEVPLDIGNGLGCTWVGTFSTSECSGDTVTHYLQEVGDGTWAGKMEWSCSDAVKYATHNSTCDPITIGAPLTDYEWTAGEIDCDCCGGGGGFGGETTVTVSCCANEISQTLTATLTTSPCTCGSSDTVTLTWDGVSAWTGTEAFGTCGKNITLSFYCSSGTLCSGFRLDISFSDSCATHTALTPTSCACDPLNVQFNNNSIDSCCGESAEIMDVTITE